MLSSLNSSNKSLKKSNNNVITLFLTPSHHYTIIVGFSIEARSMISAKATSLSFWIVSFDTPGKHYFNTKSMASCLVGATTTPWYQPATTTLNKCIVHLYNVFSKPGVPA